MDCESPQIAMRLVTFLFVVLVVLPSQAQTTISPIGFDLSPYAAPARLVDIGGRRLNLLCQGEGSPTVIFEAQLGEASWDWAPVHATVAEHTRSCIYDRAGIGFSDPSGRPGTAINAVEDLRTLLDRAQEPPPYLLVGASYGALIARYFAAKMTQDVSALVLVDGHHEEEFERINVLSKGKYAEMMESVGRQYKYCAAAAHKHIAPASSEFRACVVPAPSFANRKLAAAHLAQQLSQDYWDSTLSEWDNLDRTSAFQVRALNDKLRNTPIVALIRSISPFSPPGRPTSYLSAAVEQENKQMQQETAKLSSSGRTLVIPRASHSIHLDNSAAVAEVVVNEVARVRR